MSRQLYVKYAYLLPFLGLSLPLTTSAASACDTGSDLLSYAPVSSNQYEVMRNGKKIGDHVIHFEQDGEALKVIAETNMEVRFLFITAYQYQYRSEEQWCRSELQTVTTRVDDNGTVKETSARRSEEGYIVQRDGEEGFIAGQFPSTNHWNVAAVESDRLFNTITGKLNSVSVSALDMAGRQTQPMRYAIRGELNIDTIYDPAGNWLGMSFEHGDGSTIEFRCVDCANTPDNPA